jgi:hypothetical protein
VCSTASFRDDEHQTGHRMGSSTVAGSRPHHGLAARAGLGAAHAVIGLTLTADRQIRKVGE